MGSKAKSVSPLGLAEPRATADLVWLWNRGGAIDRHTRRCGNLMLAINVQSTGSDVPGRAEQNDNRLKRVRPGLARVDSGYMERVMSDVEGQKAYAAKARTKVSGVAKWLEEGELIVLEGGVDAMPKRDAQEAIEGSSDLTLILEIANGDGRHADIAREHLARVTGGGSAILGHFNAHDTN